jgi:lysozyme
MTTRRAAILIASGLGLALMATLANARAAAVETDDDEGGNVFDSLLDPVYAIGGAMSGAKISSRGLERLKAAEGWRAKPYRDFAGYLTIGYGHKITAGESFDELTPEEGAQLLADDVASAEDAVNSLVSVMLTQDQFDALVMFAFNVGNGALRSSTLLKRLNAGDVEGAAAEFKRWRYVTNRDGQKEESTILARRRADEADLFRGVA